MPEESDWLTFFSVGTAAEAEESEVGEQRSIARAEGEGLVKVFLLVVEVEVGVDVGGCKTRVVLPFFGVSCFVEGWDFGGIAAV